jgi:S-layer family protein
MLFRSDRLAAVVLVLSGAASLGAQSAAPDVDEFGVQDGNDLWIPASEFQANDFLQLDVATGYVSTAQGATLIAHVPLPQGAYLDSWRIFYRDASPDLELAIALVKYYGDSTSSVPPSSVVLSSFESSGAPGYDTQSFNVGQTIDLREPPPGSGIFPAQSADFYAFVLGLSGDVNIAFKGVRVFWHRQVSPAPAVATFNDVPTGDPAFQFVEALARSGITAGCGSGNFCPDAPLTRRQMAVFLSKALGLHWPPF